MLRAIADIGQSDCETLHGRPLSGLAALAEIRVRHAPAWSALLGVGATLNVLGRTSGPLFEAESLLQLHGVWHVITAMAFVAWAVKAFRTP